MKVVIVIPSILSFEFSEFIFQYCFSFSFTKLKIIFCVSSIKSTGLSSEGILIYFLIHFSISILVLF